MNLIPSPSKVTHSVATALLLVMIFLLLLAGALPSPM